MGQTYDELIFRLESEIKANAALRAEVERLKEWGAAHDRAFAAQCDREAALRADCRSLSAMMHAMIKSMRDRDPESVLPPSYEEVVMEAYNTLREGKGREEG